MCLREKDDSDGEWRQWLLRVSVDRLTNWVLFFLGFVFKFREMSVYVCRSCGILGFRKYMWHDLVCKAIFIFISVSCRLSTCWMVFVVCSVLEVQPNSFCNSS